MSTVKAVGKTGAKSTLAAPQRSLGAALFSDGKYVEANKVFEEMAAGIKTDPGIAKSYQFGDLDWDLAMFKIDKCIQANEIVGNVLKRLELSSDKNSPRLTTVSAFHAMG